MIVLNVIESSLDGDCGPESKFVFQNTYGIISMFRQYIRQQLWHPFLHGVRIGFHQRTDAQNSSVTLAYRFVVVGILPSGEVAVARQPDEPVFVR
jgi:hypothetical protein